MTRSLFIRATLFAGCAAIFFGAPSVGGAQRGAETTPPFFTKIWQSDSLTVAIPATFGYNILANRLNRLDNLLEGFGTTLIAMLGREGRI